MSTILVDNLTGKTSAGSITVTSEGGAATMQLQQGLAKAWINFNGTGTVAIRDNLNLSSLTDNGLGDYTLGFVSSMGNANYSYAGSSGGQSSTSNGSVWNYDNATARTTSLFRVILITTGGGAVDTPQIGVHVHGDLA